MFERSVLPRWLELFTIDWDRGVFSLSPNGERDLYGTLDVLHILWTIGQVDRLDAATRDDWKATIDSYQYEDGSYATSDDEPGRQPYHAVANAAASLALIDRRPAWPNADFEDMAQSGNWSATFDPLYESECYSKTLGANNIHSCGQQIGSYPATLALDNSTAFKPFLDWWVDWLVNHTDRERGLLCPVSNTTLARVQCIGGGMPTFGVMFGMDLGYRLPEPTRLLNFALQTQAETRGVWSDKDDLTELGSLTLDGIVMVTRSAAQLATQGAIDAARASCIALLDIAVPQLNNWTRVRDAYAPDSHILPNILAAVAVCADTVPNLVATSHPWSCCARYV